MSFFPLGQQYWVFNGNQLAENFTSEGRPLTSLGLPSEIKNIDAAFVWGHNRKTYFITGEMYWRFNERHARMDRGYPRDMGLWEGVPLPVDAVLAFDEGGLLK